MSERAPSHALDRRQLLRGAGVLGGAAAIAAVSAAAAPAAQAADGGDFLIGAANAADTTTSLEITPDNVPTLVLVNSDGPQLNLAPADSFTGDLAVGDIANTSQGPLIGVNYGGADETSILVTPDDLPYLVPMPTAFAPERVLDTRTSSGRASIVRKASGALTAAGQLVAGKWIDIAVGDTGSGYDLSAAFFNVTVVNPIADGYASVYTPSVGARPASSTVNYKKAITIANGGIGAIETATTSFVVRIYSSATTHLVFDLTGVVILDSGADGAAAKPRTRALTRAARARAQATRKPARR